MNMDPGSWSARVAAAIRAEMAVQQCSPAALAELLGVAEAGLARRLRDGVPPFDLVEVERVATWLGTNASTLLAHADERVAGGTSHPTTRKGTESCTHSHTHDHESLS
jgi:hypothetical protein